MKKISLLAFSCFINMVCLFSQRRPSTTVISPNSAAQTTADTSNYVDKKLKFEEANLVSGYYSQNGNKSAVTGGIGTEQLTDIANTFDLKLSSYLKKGLKQNFGVEMGIDHYTSASSDNIANAEQQKTWSTTVTTTTVSRASRGGGSSTSTKVIGGRGNASSLTSASRSDTRFYPSLNWSIKDEKQGLVVGINAAYSTEYDYKSKGWSLNIAKTSKDQSREFSAKLQAFKDTWTVIYPFELTPKGYGDGSHWTTLPVDHKPRNSYEASFALAQVINRKFQMALLADVAYQEGLLATKYQRVYFTDGSVHAETLPDKRLKIPVALRASYFLNENVILRGYYRFYKDDWGLSGHTFNLETPIKITNFVSISPFYRFYTQQQARYFAPYKMHTVEDAYYSSDYDISTFTSQYFGAGIRLTPPEGLGGIKWWNMLEIRYGHYTRSTDLVSNQIGLNLKFK
jgi:Protein of unknown function (DUF3570)